MICRNCRVEGLPCWCTVTRTSLQRRKKRTGQTAALLLVWLWLLVCVVQGQEGVPELVAENEVKRLNEEVAQLYKERKYNAALERAKRVLSIAEKELPPTHRELAQSLNNLAAVSQVRGNYWRAEQYLRRALAINEQVLEPEHPDLAAALNNLATLYYAMKEYDRAEPLLRRVLAIYEKVWGLEHRDVATILNNLAVLYAATGDHSRAERLHQRALKIRRKVLPPPHPDLAQSLNNLAMLYETTREYDRALPLLREAVLLHEQGLGSEHLDVATSLHNLALLYRAKGDVGQAIPLLTRATDIRERHITLFLATGSEEQKRAYMAMLSGDTDAAVSLHVQAAPHDPQALRLALTTVLRRKGRVLDAMADAVSAVRRHLSPQDRVLLDQLTSIRSQFATLVLDGPGAVGAAQQRQLLIQLTERAQELEEAICARSTEFRVQTQPVALEHVQAAIPQDAALVELVAYRPYEPKERKQKERWGRPRYVAYLLRRQGEPLWVDLGEAQVIDRKVTQLRRALSDPNRQEIKKLARALDEELLRPLRQLLGETRTVFLSPDGALHLLPFGALVDEQDRYLLETFTFIYLTTGRDLLWLGGRPPAQGTPVIVANPAFGEAAEIQSARSAGIALRPEPRRTVELAGMQFTPLPGTAAEARALEKVFPQATVLTGAEATETALKGLHRPSFLHIATHGFFLEDKREMSLSPGGEVELRLPGYRQSQDMVGVKNPLLRSGLAFTGANRRQEGAEDGLLTALEAAGLDLWGTQLVVLSACETGVGDVQNREGVYGLRRAMVMAGAESQVMSLWKVGDEATRDLMVAYYKRLLNGEGRAEGLRQAQLAMLWSKKHSHPFYWAGFIMSGDWRPVDGL